MDLIQSIIMKNKPSYFTRKGYAINKILTIKPNIKDFVFSDNYKVLNTSELYLTAIVR